MHSQESCQGPAVCTGHEGHHEWKTKGKPRDRRGKEPTLAPLTDVNAQDWLASEGSERRAARLGRKRVFFSSHLYDFVSRVGRYFIIRTNLLTMIMICLQKKI